jgi:single-stranded-DNA-specific exonuclease
VGKIKGYYPHGRIAKMREIKFRGEADREAQIELASYPKLLRDLLSSRGITKNKEAEEFLNPNYEMGTHDPYLMKDMDKAVLRILKALRRNEKITIYSDYDADGVPGGIVLRDFFNKTGYTNVSNYIPHRHEEGFGLNRDALAQIRDEGSSLVITVDCGIADGDEIEHAKSSGLDVIITDHHESKKEKLPADAVLDPKQPGCLYPDKNLCGAGVAYKLVQALVKESSFNIPQGWEKWLLDLVGLATLSDMVPLRGENRIFSYYGLKVLRKTPRIGLNSIFRKLRINKSSLLEDDIVFSLTPKLNAASRMGSAESAFRLLQTSDQVQAEEAASELIEANNKRKGVVGSMVREIKREMAERAFGDGPIVMGNPSWRPSLLGLVAGGLAKEFNKPVFLWGRDGENIIKGSCRSEGVTNVLQIMNGAADHFKEFGGHAFSGGFSVANDKIHFLEDALNRSFKRGNNVITNEGLLVDKILSIDEVNRDNYNLISKLAPFGQENEKPIFLFEDLKVQQLRMFGKEKNHLEMTFRQTFGDSIKSICFFAPDTLSKIPQEGERVNLVATLDQSSFMGRTELRLRVVDLL